MTDNITGDWLDELRNSVQTNLNKAIEIVQAQPSHPPDVDDPAKELGDACGAINTCVEHVYQGMLDDMEQMSIHGIDEWVRIEYEKQFVALSMRMQQADDKLEGLGISPQANMDALLQVANMRANAFKYTHNWWLNIQEDMSPDVVLLDKYPR